MDSRKEVTLLVSPDGVGLLLGKFAKQCAEEFLNILIQPCDAADHELEAPLTAQEALKSCIDWQYRKLARKKALCLPNKEDVWVREV